MAEQTMFERLTVAAASARKKYTMIRDLGTPNVEVFCGDGEDAAFIGSESESIAWVDGHLICAVLAETRNIAAELPHGFVTVANPAIAPKVNIAATDQTFLKAGVVAFIDAILAESGGSGG